MQTTRILSETVVRCGSKKDMPAGRDVTTIYGWRMTGLKNRRTGETFTLEWCYLAGETVTSKEALLRFFEKLNRNPDEIEDNPDARDTELNNATVRPDGP